MQKMSKYKKIYLYIFERKQAKTREIICLCSKRITLACNKTKHVGFGK